MGFVFYVFYQYFYGNTFFSKLTKSDIYPVKQRDNEAYHIIIIVYLSWS